MKTLTRTVELGGQSLGPLDVTRSSGALAVYGGGCLLDASRRELVARLGYNASPLFGIAHHAQTWTGEATTEESGRIANAVERLRRRWARRHADDSLGRWLPSLDAPPGLAAAPLPSPRRDLATYIVGSMLDQYADQVERIERQSAHHAARLQASFPAVIASVEAVGLDVRVSIDSAQDVQQLIDRRFLFGLDFASEAPHRIDFHFNLAFRDSTLDRFWQQFHNLVASLGTDRPVEAPTVGIEWTDPAPSLDFIRQMAELRGASAASRTVADQSIAVQYLDSLLDAASSDRLRTVVLQPATYPGYRQRILDLQVEVYEPARQSPPEEFDAVFESGRPVAVLVMDGERIAGMGLAGPLVLYPEVRGVAGDPFRHDPHVLYMVDVTVRSDYRGGMGRWIKNAVALRALEMGYSAIHGRNRDRVARGMWAINLSLGSYELQYLRDDYPDEGAYRDCLYYRCPLVWPAGIGLPCLTAEEIARKINDQPD